MCLKVYMPNGTTTPPGCPDPNDVSSYPGCSGDGTEPYSSSVADPLNYGAKVEYDSERQLPYFTAMIIEWLDRCYTHLPPTNIFLSLALSRFGLAVKKEQVPCGPYSA